MTKPSAKNPLTPVEHFWAIWLIKNVVRPIIAMAESVEMEWLDSVSISFESRDGLTKHAFTAKHVCVADLKRDLALLAELEQEQPQ